MMPEVPIHYLMAIFRAFLLIIGQKMNVSMIALDKSGINMKCSDGLKPLCAFVTLCTQEFLFNSFIMSSVNMTPYIFSPNQQQAKMDFKKLK